MPTGCNRCNSYLLIVICFILYSLTLGNPADSISVRSETRNQNDTLHYILDEIVVTGTRTFKKIIDIPYSVQRIDNSHFKYDRLVGVNEVLKTIPGLFLQSRYGNHDVRISIRGFGSRSNTGIRGVRILLDGIPESEPDGQTRIEAIDFNAIGTIEVVKGNSSSLYTNAPGGVINFINDIDFPKSFFVNFNDIGSYGLRRNGIKTGIKTDNYRFLLTYSYHNYKGYRRHSDDYWHILNTVLESSPNENSKLQLLGYFVDGRIRLPGSLTREQFEEDPIQANQREVDRDTKRISKKGRVAVRFRGFLDSAHRNELEVTAYGTIKYFERTSREYRIINRFGLGASARYVIRYNLLKRENEFSVGGDFLHQTGPIEYYGNINGHRGDGITALTDETIANKGIYFQNNINLVPGKLDFLITGRYDQVTFDQKDRQLAVRSAVRNFEAFTPKAALNYKITPFIVVYTSYGTSFDSPAGNELDNFPVNLDPNNTKLINPFLKAQNSNFFELGTKGNFIYRGTKFFNNIYYEVTYFNYFIDDEIVPFEFLGEVYFRNAANTIRNGVEVGINIELIRGLRFESAYTYSHFVYDNYTARSYELNSAGNLEIIDREFSNNIVPSVPEHNLSISISYERILRKNLVGFLKGNYRTASSMYVDDLNTEKTDAFNLINVTMGIDLKISRMNIVISGGVNNIFDLKYAAFININSARREFYEAGEPRNFYASLRLGYSF